MPSGTTPWNTWTELRPVSDQTFMDRALAGEFANPEYALDDAIDTWHACGSGMELSAYLGMTRAEFREWVRDPGALDGIIARRRP